MNGTVGSQFRVPFPNTMNGPDVVLPYIGAVAVRLHVAPIGAVITRFENTACPPLAATVVVPDSVQLALVITTLPVPGPPVRTIVTVGSAWPEIPFFGGFGANAIVHGEPTICVPSTEVGESANVGPLAAGPA